MDSDNIELNKVNDIINKLQNSLPNTTIVLTETFVDSVIESLKEPSETFEDQIKEFCNENVIDKTIEINLNRESVIKMRVTLDKANYGNYLYYRVICDKLCENEFDDHPFSNVPNNHDRHNNLEIGNVVADNKMMREMFNVLAMTDNELEKICGHCTPNYYRSNIINCIETLWD